jgi:hypothetical protein
MFIDELLVDFSVHDKGKMPKQTGKFEQEVSLMSNGHTDESAHSPAARISHNPPTDSQGWVCRTKQ